MTGIEPRCLQLPARHSNHCRHDIHENLHITKCYHCHQLGHSAKFCKVLDQNICAKCGNNHLTEECQKPDFSCWVCSNAKLGCNHRVNDMKCPNYITKLNLLKLKTRYN